MKKIFLVLLLLLSSTYAKKHITVTLPVQKYFFEKIAKNNYIVHVVESRIEKFELNNIEFMNRLAYSKIYYTLGLKQEKEYIKKLKEKNKFLKIKDLSTFYKKDVINGEEVPYFWMDPLLNRKFAKLILEESIKHFPRKKAEFTQNYELLLDEMDKIYLSIKKRLDVSENLNFLAYETYWHYFAKRFKIHIFYREKRVTKLEEVSSLIEFAKKKDIKKLIVNKGTKFTLIHSISSHINVKTVINDPTSYDWKPNIYELSKKLSR